jgi:UDP-N-acetylglucosamine 2-epimerase
VLVYGDTNSTIAGALSAAKLDLPVAHVEAGLRSYNNKMPEEINRKVTDVLSSLLFCPTKLAVNNLRMEGITRNVFLTGDVMFDAFLQNLAIAEKNNKILKELNLTKGHYSLVTIHRAENTDNDKNLNQIMRALRDSNDNIVFPLHPRTKKNLEDFDIHITNNIKIIKPVGYLDMLILEKNARIIITDSGGVQKEAFFLRKPCVTLRDETEWKETVDSGANILVGTNPQKISDAIRKPATGNFADFFYGRGDASDKIVEHISNYLN